jgi:hypothetical protein
MPLDAATGPISLPEKYLADQIAASAGGQALLGVASANDALLRIHFDSLPPPRASNEYEKAELEEYRPFIVICTNPREGWQYTRTSFLTFPESGSLIVEVEKNVPRTPDKQERKLHENMRTFKNQLGALAKDVAALASQAGYLDIQRIALLTLFQSDPELEATQGDFLLALLRVDWGARA